VKAYFEPPRLRSVLATFYRAHFRTMFLEHIRQDLQPGGRELLWLDLLCLLYMPYRDVKLWRQLRSSVPPAQADANRAHA
jgi:hypothetical protein